jgi:hypothetical protein
MPCRFFDIKDAKGNVVGHGLACSRSRKEAVCGFCGAKATLLCDGVLSRDPVKTCDKHICPTHARRIIHHSGPKDLCPDCQAAGRKAW